MVLDKLILDNFLTYDHLEYEFENKPLLIQGLNLTDDNQRTNGTGKSGIQTGIEFCITASNSRDVRDSELVTYGESEARCQLFASCDVRKETIHIDWIIKVKGSNKLTLKSKAYDSNEWTDKKFSTSLDGKKYILNWFAISKEDLFNYYIINNTRFKSFFKSSNKEKVDLINRFSDASIIKGLENIDNSELEEKLEKAQRRLNSTEGKIELLKSQIYKENNRDFESEMQEEIEDIKEEIEDIKNNIEGTKLNIQNNLKKTQNIKDEDIKDEEENIEVCKREKEDIKSEINTAETRIAAIAGDVKRAQSFVDDFITTNWDENRDAIKDIIKSDKLYLEEQENIKKKRDDQLTKLLKLLEGINIKLSGSITCPNCSHEFVLDGDIEKLKSEKAHAEKLGKRVDTAIGDIKSLISNAEASIKILDNDLSNINKKESAEFEEKRKLQQKVDEIKKKLEGHENTLNDLKREDLTCDQDIEKYKNRIVKHNNDIIKIKDSNKNLKDKIENYKKEIESWNNNIDNLSLGNNKERINILEKDLTSLEHALTIESAEIATINDSIYERNQWIANFKQFRMYLANQSLEVIQYHCNRYLTDMGSDMKIKMEGFKVLANGTYKEEITAKIIRDQERTFSSFSGGERGRLLFASILANRHMINDTHPYGGFDFLAIDEVFEGIDSMGLKNIISSAKTLDVPVMVITHVTDEEANSDRLLIVKENGISKIKVE